MLFIRENRKEQTQIKEQDYTVNTKMETVNKNSQIWKHCVHQWMNGYR